MNSLFRNASTLRSSRSLRACIQFHHILPRRSMSSSKDPLFRPSPPPLPRADQREFEELVRKAQTPLARSHTGDTEEADLSLHPDARPPVEPEFEGDTNPSTGEKGGPKREPVHRWTQDGGDWSFKGRVSDF